MKSIFIAICLFSSMSAQALTTDAVNSAGWGNLTPVQQAELLKQVTNSVATNEAAKVAEVYNDPQKINQWVDLGVHIGQAFGGAAHEIGVATSEFIKTPIGMVTTALIIGHFVGGALMHICGAIVILIIGFGFIKWHSSRIRCIKEQYSQDKVDIFKRPILLSREIGKIDDVWAGWYIAIGVLTVTVSMCTLFNF